MSTRILIADDDAKLREGLVLICELLGHRVFEAESGRFMPWVSALNLSPVSTAQQSLNFTYFDT